MMPTSRLPGTVFLSSAECPCTSALGLFTRKYSAGRSKRSPPSNVTVNVLRSLCRRNSVGQASRSVISCLRRQRVYHSKNLIAFLIVRGHVSSSRQIHLIKYCAAVRRRVSPIVGH